MFTINFTVFVNSILPNHNRMRSVPAIIHTQKSNGIPKCTLFEESASKHYSAWSVITAVTMGKTQ